MAAMTLALVVNLVLEADLSAAARTDELAETVDYGEVSRAVGAHVAGARFQLIEALAQSIGEVVLAVNANRTIPDYFESGEWRPRPSIATLASAMDVGDPSNMERMFWRFRDHAGVRGACAAAASVKVTVGVMPGAVPVTSRVPQPSCPRSMEAA